MNFCKYFALSFVMISCLLTYTNSEYRIIGGTDWNIEDSAYLVSIYYNIDDYICVGSLVTREKVVTSANCVAFLDVDFLVVAAGVTDLRHIRDWTQFRPVIGVRHPRDYNPNTKYMDIAVMTLRGPFGKSPTIKTIQYCGCTFEERTTMRVSGWGWTTEENGMRSDTLKSTELDSLPYNVCENYARMAGRTFTRSMICAAHDGADVCVGDSGAPGVVDGKMCAVVSHNQGCLNRDYPTVFTVINDDIIAFLDEEIHC
ncbi:trypsin beta-like [Eurosta solidaginis]|uniref:trypsin beta-like n=1 Tax=Eurosta solidaginis TaxID=178769 RepID=UPI003530A149